MIAVPPQLTPHPPPQWTQEKNKKGNLHLNSFRWPPIGMCLDVPGIHKNACVHSVWYEMEKTRSLGLHPYVSHGRVNRPHFMWNALCAITKNIPTCWSWLVWLHGASTAHGPLEMWVTSNCTIWFINLKLILQKNKWVNPENEYGWNGK